MPGQEPFLADVYDAGFRDLRAGNREKRLAEIREIEAALRRSPDDPALYIQLAERSSPLQALPVFEQALERCPPSLELYRGYIHALRRCNRTEEAIAAADRCLEVLPEASDIRILRRLVLPVLYRAQEEIEPHRRRFEAGLSALSEETDLDTAAGRSSALQAVESWTNFYLAYQGLDDLELQRRYGRLLGRVMAANYPQWASPVEMPPPGPGGRLRVGYVSGLFRHHTVMKNHLGWLREHDRSRIDVYTYHVGAIEDPTTLEAERASIRMTHAPDDLERACRAIREDRPHVLVYLDIGMIPISGSMAALRLAPVQCATWGHPVTTGLETVDYFLSSELMEPEDGDAHYSERLVRLPGIGISYRTVIPRPLLRKTRADYGLREDAVVYLSCQSLFKYLPEHDFVFAEIAARAPAAQFVFVGPNEAVTADFRRRLERAFQARGLRAQEFCAIMPPLNQFDFWNLNLCCDVYLDTMSWSGGTSTLEAIACGLPVVTTPGRFMRGRHSFAFLKQLGVTDTIAPNVGAYVDLAVRLGSDREWQRGISARMQARLPSLFGEQSCVRALEAFYERAVTERSSLRPSP